MNIRPFLFASVASALCAFTSLQAQEPKPAAHEEKETELDGTMGKVNAAFRKLRRQAGDATKNEESLKLVAEMKAAAQESAKLVPAKASDFTGADREKFISEFHARMKTFIGDITRLEDALKAGKNDEAAKIADELQKMKSSGHKEFQRPPVKK